MSAIADETSMSGPKTAHHSARGESNMRRDSNGTWQMGTLRHGSGARVRRSGGRTTPPIARRLLAHAAALLFAACAALAVVPPAHSAQEPVCPGDCNTDGTVAVNELVTMVNMALGATDVSACGVADANGNGTISIDEILQAVGMALEGCDRSLDLVGAVALSQHYIAVEFSGPVGDAAAQPGRYWITAPNGSSLAVSDARIMDDDPSRVLLTTDAQTAVGYRVPLPSGSSA